MTGHTSCARSNCSRGQSLEEIAAKALAPNQPVFMPAEGGSAGTGSD